jgi:hypothetical protein
MLGRGKTWRLRQLARPGIDKGERIAACADVRLLSTGDSRRYSLAVLDRENDVFMVAR